MFSTAFAIVTSTWVISMMMLILILLSPILELTVFVFCLVVVIGVLRRDNLTDVVIANKDRAQ